MEVTRSSKNAWWTPRLHPVGDNDWHCYYHYNNLCFYCHQQLILLFSLSSGGWQKFFKWLRMYLCRKQHFKWSWAILQKLTTDICFKKLKKNNSLNETEHIIKKKSSLTPLLVPRADSQPFQAGALRDSKCLRSEEIFREGDVELLHQQHHCQNSGAQKSWNPCHQHKLVQQV